MIELLAKLDLFEYLGVLLHLGTPSHKFVVADRNTGWSGRDIEKMLKHYGIKMWGRGFSHDTLTFRVQRKQAKWAEYLLHQHGIPVSSKPFYARNVTYFQGPKPAAPQQCAPNFLEEIVAFILG
jgi:hypothetical protein